MHLRFRKAAVVLVLATVAGQAMAASPADLAIADPALKGAKTLKVSSPKIAPGAPIPEVYSSYGQGVSPPLAWSKPQAAPPVHEIAVKMMLKRPLRCWKAGCFR